MGCCRFPEFQILLVFAVPFSRLPGFLLNLHAVLGVLGDLAVHTSLPLLFS
jgi:hypothetical protein